MSAATESPVNLSDLNVCVILPAAGTGSRLGDPTPKQYLNINGKPLFMYSVNHFESLSYVKSIIIVADDVTKMSKSIIVEDNLDRVKIKIVKGGTSRHRSILAGLQTIDKTDVVIIHDAVRPIIPSGLVNMLTSLAVKHKAAGVIRPLTSTVLAVDEFNFLDHALDRSKYFASETPQSFLFDVLKIAYEKCSDLDLDNNTECLDLVHKYAMVKPKLVNGTADLWKVTHLKDVFAAEGYLRIKNTQVYIVGASISPTVSDALIEKLKTKTQIEVYNPVTNDDTSNMYKYNSVVYIHDSNIESFDVMFNTLHPVLDTTNSGTIIHVIKLNKFVEQFSEHVIYKKIASDFYSRKKRCVFILWWGDNEVSRVVDIITNILFINSDCFHGQVLSVGSPS